MTEGSKEAPSALDGYERAKPDEPVFTLQGGDRFAHPALRGYIKARREAALSIPDERLQGAELVRCAEAENILFNMEAYYKGQPADTEDLPAFDVPLTEQISLRQYQIMAAKQVSNMASTVNTMVERLHELGLNDEAAQRHALATVSKLTRLRVMLDPRRGRERS